MNRSKIVSLVAVLVALLAFAAPAPAQASTTVPAGLVFGVDPVPTLGLLALAAGESGVIVTGPDPHRVGSGIGAGVGAARVSAAGRHRAGHLPGPLRHRAHGRQDRAGRSPVRPAFRVLPCLARRVRPLRLLHQPVLRLRRRGPGPGVRGGQPRPGCLQGRGGELAGATGPRRGRRAGHVTGRCRPDRHHQRAAPRAGGTVVRHHVVGRPHLAWRQRDRPGGHALADGSGPARQRPDGRGHPARRRGVSAFRRLARRPACGGRGAQRRRARGGVDLAAPDKAVELPSTLPEDHYVCTRCLAPGPRPAQLVATSLPYFDGSPALQTLGTAPTGLSLQAPEQVQLTRAVALSAELRYGAGSMPPTGTPLRWFRQAEYSGEPPVLLGTSTTDSSGTAAFSDLPPQRRLYRYSVQFDSDATQAASRTERLIDVTPAPATLTASFTRTASKGKQVTGNLDVRLSPVVDVREVHVEARTGTGTAYAGTHTLAADGTLRLPLTLQPPAQIMVSFFGGSQQADARTTVSIQR